MAVREEIVEMIHEQFDIPVEKIKPEASLILDLGVDSLDIVEFIMAIEDRFSIEVSDEAVEKIHNIGDIICCVEELRQ